MSDPDLGSQIRDDVSAARVLNPFKAVVEPLEPFKRHIEQTSQLYAPGVHRLIPAVLRTQAVSHRRWQTDFPVSQGGRGTCWAFAGIAALEAAYARTGVRVSLSEQYLFHLCKAHENHRNNGGINSLIGFQGAADIIHHLSLMAVPLYEHAPYLDQGPLQTLANSIPDTGGALANAASGSREQNDWFEYDLRHIPLMARWFPQYRVKSYGVLTNFTNDDLRKVIADGYDVVVNVNDKINNGGHVILIFGYNDATQRFQIKNSQGLPGFATMAYQNDGQFDILYGSAYYIKEVHPVQTQWAGLWLGRWECDHDGWRGRLIIRRFTDLLQNYEMPGPGARLSLGTWYGENGQVLDVRGHFVDGGRGLICTIGDQPFELYLHTQDPYRASGRCFWNHQPFGVVLSRGTATGAGGGFDRTEAIGLWDMVHDGWRGTLRIGVEPSYVQAADSVTRGAHIEPGPVPHIVDTRIDFGGDNRDQRFQLLVHTREDGVFGGVTSWGGRDWPVEGRMSKNLYTVAADGKLRWYRHTGRARQVFEWDPEKVVGTGWAGFARVFGGGDGVVYGIRPDGVLLWYYHDGRNQGTFQWQGPREVGTGWHSFTQVFAGDGGVVYGITRAGKLLWYRHLGRRDGSATWKGPVEVGTGWDMFTTVAAGADGCLYGLRPDGTLWWYRHYGHDHGYPIWHGPLQVGVGWQEYDALLPVGNGYFYARARRSGDLFLWRHHGFLTGEFSWTSAAKVGNGWGGELRHLFAT